MVDRRRVTVARARPRASSCRAKLSMSAQAHREQRQGTAATPAGELAQVQGVGLAGQAAVPGQVAGEGEPFGIGEGGLDRGERGGWGGSGQRAPPGQAGTREAGPVPAPAVQRKSNVSRLARSRYAGNKPAAWRSNPREEHSIPPNLCACRSDCSRPRRCADVPVLELLTSNHRFGVTIPPIAGRTSPGEAL